VVGVVGIVTDCGSIVCCCDRKDCGSMMVCDVVNGSFGSKLVCCG